MAEAFPDIMTIEEAARYLRIPLSSLYRLAQARKIPCQKVGRHWRFRKEAINCWLAEKLPVGGQGSLSDGKTVTSNLS
jgi:excisionase family DNA binding protein